MKAKRLIGTAALAATMLALSAGAGLAAEPPACQQRHVMAERLEASYGETRQLIGLSASNQIVEVFASARTGTWSMTVTKPGGRTCLVSTGESYAQFPEKFASQLAI